MASKERLTTGIFIEFGKDDASFNVFLTYNSILSLSPCFLMTRLQSVYIENSGFFSWKPHRKAFEGLPFATQDGRELAALVVIQRQGTNQILFTSILARFDGDQTSNKQMTKPPKTAQTRCVVVHGQHARSRAVPGFLLGTRWTRCTGSTKSKEQKCFAHLNIENI